MGALAALLVAGGAAVGSGAAFTTETANPSNTFTSGVLKVDQDGNGAVLTATGLVPGESASGTVTIKNTGTVDGSSWKLTQAVTSSTPGADPANPAATGDLADRLQLTVVDQTSGTPVYSGALVGLSSADLPTIAKNTERTYRFDVGFPGGGSDDNRFQGGSLTTSYTWSASAGS